MNDLLLLSLLLGRSQHGYALKKQAGAIFGLGEMPEWQRSALGMAVVIVSSDLEEVLGLSHRVLVLSRGRQRGVLEAEQASHVAVMELATT